MSLGADRAGIKVNLAVEMHPAACATYAFNHPNAKVVQIDLKNFTIPIFDRSTEEVILFGGPPCQGFSTSNQRTRTKNNDRNWLFVEFLRCVRAIRPDWVVFENVSGILQTENGKFARDTLEGLKDLGFRTQDGLLNAADFGCPQNRTRYFIIGSRNQSAPNLPTGYSRHIPVKEAIGDLPVLTNGATEDLLPYATDAVSTYSQTMRAELQECYGHLVSRNADNIVERYSFIPPGGNWRNIPGLMRSDRNDYRRYHHGIYRRLDEGKLSVVIGNFRKSMLIHPTQDRGLSVREAARLQSFPDEYRFFGSIGLQQQQVGNAVPPLLAQAVFSEITRRNMNLPEAQLSVVHGSASGVGLASGPVKVARTARV